MRIPAARKLGFRIERRRRPLSRGVAYVVTHNGLPAGTAYGRAELGILLDRLSGFLPFEAPLEPMPGAKAAVVRKGAHYL